MYTIVLRTWPATPKLTKVSITTGSSWTSQSKPLHGCGLFQWRDIFLRWRIKMGRPTVCLHAIVKNEEKILLRLLESTRSFVTDAVIVDTGSTDGTLDLLGQYPHFPITVLSLPFVDFGQTRTRALHLARQHTTSDYILLMDADMVLVVGTEDVLEACTADVYSVIQVQSGVAYPNTRLIRRTVTEARYIGSTHEYLEWPATIRQGDRMVATTTAELERHAIWINDLADGGCKTDKYERDERLLLGDLERDARCGRTLFYLAQTYKEQGKLTLALAYYVQRIATDPHHQESIYSLYQACRISLGLGHVAMARYYAEACPRAEPSHLLCEYYLNAQDLVLAGAYYIRALSFITTPLPHPRDLLFMETDVYTHGVHLQGTMLWYYISPDRTHGRTLSMRYLDAGYPYADMVHDNLVFYAEPLLPATPPILDLIPPEGWIASTPTLVTTTTSFQRCVNYTIGEDGAYTTTTPDDMVRTLYVWHSDEGHPATVTVCAPEDLTRDPASRCVGVEDLRCVISEAGSIQVLAASMEWTHTPGCVSQVYGTFDPLTHTLTLSHLMHGFRGPGASEKNWVWMGPDRIVYEWYPEIVMCTRDGDRLVRQRSSVIPSRPCMQWMRGSTNGVLWDGRWWFVTHSVVQTRAQRRQYLHWLVVMDEVTLHDVSAPFTLRASPVADIEYCTSLLGGPEGLTVGYSVGDASTCTATVPWSRIYQQFLVRDS
jgi:glycosyltransferase involved in cell wall biosynthesis